MSGVEIGIAVVAAVAALISAYKDSDKIWARIKKNRGKRGCEPPSTGLTDALTRGRDEISRLRDEYPQARLDGMIHSVSLPA